MINNLSNFYFNSIFFLSFSSENKCGQSFSAREIAEQCWRPTNNSCISKKTSINKYERPRTQLKTIPFPFKPETPNLPPISHKILKKSDEMLCEMHREYARGHYQVDKARAIRDEDRMTGRSNFSRVGEECGLGQKAHSHSSKATIKRDSPPLKKVKIMDDTLYQDIPLDECELILSASERMLCGQEGSALSPKTLKTLKSFVCFYQKAITQCVHNSDLSKRKDRFFLLIAKNAEKITSFCLEENSNCLDEIENDIGEVFDIYQEIMSSYPSNHPHYLEVQNLLIISFRESFEIYILFLKSSHIEPDNKYRVAKEFFNQEWKENRTERAQSCLSNYLPYVFKAKAEAFEILWNSYEFQDQEAIACIFFKEKILNFPFKFPIKLFNILLNFNFRKYSQSDLPTQALKELDRIIARVQEIVNEEQAWIIDFVVARRYFVENNQERFHAILSESLVHLNQKNQHLYLREIEILAIQIGSQDFLEDYMQNYVSKINQKGLKVGYIATPSNKQKTFLLSRFYLYKELQMETTENLNSLYTNFIKIALKALSLNDDERELTMHRLFSDIPHLKSDPKIFARKKLENEIPQICIQHIQFLTRKGWIHEAQKFVSEYSNLYPENIDLKQLHIQLHMCPEDERMSMYLLERGLENKPKRGEFWILKASLHLNPLSIFFDINQAEKALELAERYTAHMPEIYTKKYQLALIKSGGTIDARELEIIKRKLELSLGDYCDLSWNLLTYDVNYNLKDKIDIAMRMVENIYQENRGVYETRLSPDVQDSISTLDQKSLYDIFVNSLGICSGNLSTKILTMSNQEKIITVLANRC